MVLTQRRETETGWCYIDWMVLTQRRRHRLDGANTEAGDIDWMVLTQRQEM